MPSNDLTRSDLIDDEGIRLWAYQDTLGYWTIGIGRLIDARKGGGISTIEANYLCDNDIERTTIQLIAKLSWFNNLNEIRQSSLINLAFNMGVDGLLKFPKMLFALQNNDWATASQELQNSLWAKQVQKTRVDRNVKYILTGVR